jgi:exodeoxyribonuclease VII small subunit
MMTVCKPAGRNRQAVMTRRADVAAKKPKSEDDTVQSASEAPDFEQALAQLEAIVEQLEQGDLSLDESLQQFERGVQLTRTCQSALKQAEQKVEILLRRTGELNEFETANFDAGQTDAS